MNILNVLGKSVDGQGCDVADIAFRERFVGIKETITEMMAALNLQSYKWVGGSGEMADVVQLALVGDGPATMAVTAVSKLHSFNDSFVPNPPKELKDKAMELFGPLIAQGFTVDKQHVAKRSSTYINEGPEFNVLCCMLVKDTYNLYVVIY